MKRLFIIISFLLILTSQPVPGQNKKALTVKDLWAMQRIGSFDLSPDGGKLVFSVTKYDMDKNKGNADIWLINTDGTELHPLKNSAENESDPKFLPDGKRISYSYKNQIWLCNSDGSNTKQLTDLSTGASGAIWSHNGKKLLFVSDVYPDCKSDSCNKVKDDKLKTSPVKAKIFTELMYRDWDHWRGKKRSHLFLVDLTTHDVTDLTFQSVHDVPPVDLGGAQDYNFSPSGNEVAYTMNRSKVLATSTNNDIFIINLKGLNKTGLTPSTKISTSLGNDNNPVYSPNGKYIAFLSMKQAGFEADKQRVMLYNRATSELKNLSANLDISARQLVWSPDSRFIYFTAANEINNSVYKINIKTGGISVIVKDRYNTGILVSNDGSKIYFKQQRSTQPYEIFSASSSGKNLLQITHLNEQRLKNIEMNDLDTFWAVGAENTKVQSILIKPPFFNPEKKYPLIFLIHGGPQGHWSNDFHYRWNIQLFASKGYVVVAPNPRGSTGYGQKFTNEVSKDWGGKPYIDLMNSYDYALKHYNFIDKNNTFAAGASYGGYMINWIEGHTNRFNALVCHDGVFDLTSMYGSTEELWFPEWEFDGTPWENRTLYKKWSPHMFVQNFKTPMLVVQGAHDFRVPETQAMELFTSLQRMGVESKFLYFPDETHFVQKPLNSKLWWSTIFNWFEDHKKENLK